MFSVKPSPVRWKPNLCAADESELQDLNTDPEEFDNFLAAHVYRDRMRHMAARPCI